LQVKSRSPEFP